MTALMSQRDKVRHRPVDKYFSVYADAIKHRYAEPNTNRLEVCDMRVAWWMNFATQRRQLSMNITQLTKEMYA